MSYYGFPQGFQTPSPAVNITDQVKAEAHAEERLQRTRARFSNTQQELSELIRVRSLTPVSNRVELEHKDRQIAELKRLLDEHGDKIRMLERERQQMQTTITTQSRLIQNPQSDIYNTPHRGLHYQILTQPRSGEGHAAPPPPYNPLAAPSTPSVRGGQGYVSNPFQQDPFSNPQSRTAKQTPTYHTPVANAFGSPQSQRQNNNNHGALIPFQMGGNQFSTPTASRMMSAASFPGFVPTPSPQSMRGPSPSTYNVHITQSDAVISDELKTKMKNLFARSTSFAWSHANHPAAQHDHSLPQAIKERVLQAASRTSAANLMNSPLTRYLLVAKIINQWLVKHILKQDCFAGLDKATDESIAAAKKAIFSNTPYAVRYLYLSTITTELRKIKHHPGFQQHLANLAKQRGNELWGIVKPLMYVKTARDWDDLYELVVEAHNVAYEMYNTSEEYKFTFPNVGDFFKKETMHTTDPSAAMYTKEELEAQGMKIRLGVAPHVGVRLSSPSGDVVTGNGLMALVLLKIN